jgi:hypothetical protein
MIPKILHQTWKTDQIPDHWRPYQRSWIANHPDWEYRLWTDADNLALVEQHYPQFLDLYQSFAYAILRVDLVRMLYLHRYGGLYVDLDFESLKPLGPLLGESRIVIGQENEGAGKMLRGRDYILNALMASPPGHAFWEGLANRVSANYRPKRNWEIRELYILRTVVEQVDDHAVNYQRWHDDLHVLPSDMIYPSMPHQRDPTLRRRMARTKDAYAVHHYDDTWFSTSAQLFMTLRFALHRVWNLQQIARAA